MGQDNPLLETPFAKARSYLNFKSSAKWAAILSSALISLVYVALLGLLLLFADLMAWRGRVPALHELSPRQTRILNERWSQMDNGDRDEILNGIKLEPGPEEKASNEKDFRGFSVENKRLIWEAMAYHILADQVGKDAADQVIIPNASARSRYILDSSDHGILSLVVRENISGRMFNPVPWIARWNSWMWNKGSSQANLFPPYLAGLLLSATFLGMVAFFLVVFNKQMAALATTEATTRLRRAVYHHTFRLGNLAVKSSGPGEAVSILTRHVEAVHDALFAYLTKYIREPFVLFGLLLFAFYIDPILALAFLLFSLLVWQIGLRIQNRMTAQTRLASNVAAERLTIIRESLMMMRMVKCFLMEPFNQARIERQLSRYAKVQKLRHRLESFVKPAQMLLAFICAMVLFFAGALLVLSGQLSAAGAMVLSISLYCLFPLIKSWLEAQKLVKRGSDSARQVFGFLERRGEVGQVVGAEFLSPLARRIEFDHVVLKEPGSDNLLLDGVSLTIQAGQKIGLVGADVGEKNAIFYLLPRLLDPTSGEIRIDDQNLRWVTLDSLRSQIAIVARQNLVFHDTVKNNIGCGDPSFTQPQIIEAAKLAHAHNFIQKLPEGYETPVGELGHSLKLSEQYRIALARAILRDPALVILEEPEAELDEETRNLLDDTLARFLPERTAILIPHRISTLKSCDRIYLLHKGQVVDSGTHKELLGRSKLYRHLHYLEFNQMEEAI